MLLGNYTHLPQTLFTPENMARIARSISMHPGTIVLLLAVFAMTGPAACGTRDGTSSGSFLERQDSDAFQFRVLSWNVKFGTIFPPDGRRHAGFARIVRAVNPDVLALQEVNPAEVERLAKLMDRILPLGHSRLWQIHGAADLVIISRYPLHQQESELVVPRPLPGYAEFHLGQVMALVDLPDRRLAADVYVVNMHNRSGAGEENANKRQMQSDSIMRWLREIRQVDALPQATPIVVLGDMNVHPGSTPTHLTTLLTGDIIDERGFGPDFTPDWDGTGLADASPSHNARGEVFYTWRNDSEDYPPGSLSRILYSDSVMQLHHELVLNTVTMTAGELHQHGLLATDCLLDGEVGQYDHLPVIADFVISQ